MTEEKKEKNIMILNVLLSVNDFLDQVYKFA